MVDKVSDTTVDYEDIYFKAQTQNSEHIEFQNPQVSK